MAIELASGARESASVAGNVFTLLGEDNTSISFLDAITKTASTVNGSTVYCYAFNSADPTEWERMKMTYATSGDTLTRVSTLDGSNGASAVTFSGNVTIYRVITEFDMKPSSLRILQKNVYDVTTSLVTAGSATTTAFTDASATQEIPPLSSNSSIIVRWNMNGLVERTTSGAYALANLRCAYIDSLSATQMVGTNATSKYENGLDNLPSDADQGVRFGCSGVFKLDQSDLNASGDWEVLLRYYVNNSGTDFTLSNLVFEIEEFE